MEHLLDFTITNVYEAKNNEGKLIEGEGEYGPWKLFSFNTDKTGKEKFAYMWGGEKPIPEKGMNVKHMEYESETKGQYTNLNVKKLELPEQTKSSASKSSSKTTSQQKPSNDNRDTSFYVAYAKDIAVAMLAKDVDLLKLDAACEKVAKAGLIMMNESLGSVVNTPSESPEGGKAASKTSAPDLTSENEKLSKHLQTYALADKKRYFEILGQHGATRASEVYEFADDAQKSLLDDLEKELGDIPF